MTGFFLSSPLTLLLVPVAVRALLTLPGQTHRHVHRAAQQEDERHDADDHPQPRTLGPRQHNADRAYMVKPGEKYS